MFILLEASNLILFKKTVKVWIDTCETSIFSIIAVNGVPISRIQCDLQPDGSLLIGDILPFRRKIDYCKGYGSIMMTELLKYAAQIGVHTIRGNLSLVDIGHKNRLHAFYKKPPYSIFIGQKVFCDKVTTNIPILQS